MVLPIFRNPYWSAGPVVCKVAVNWATLVWALVVLLKPDALHSTAYGWTGDYVNEDVIAGPMALLSITHFVWLARHWPPLRWGCSGYGVMAFFWLLIFFAILFNDGPIQPTSLAGTSTLAALAAWAFAANPRSGERGMAD